MASGATPSGRFPRQVSVLFVDVVDSTLLLRGLDAEEGHDMLDGALRRFGAAVHAHGGRVLRYTGDGLKAVFGLPEPAADDAERAVRAGLEILRHAEAHAAEVQRQFGLAGFALRAGIHTGPLALRAAEEGHTLVGATVQLAARLEEQAPAGSLCISHDTWQALCGGFDVQARDPLNIEGLETPVPNYRVLGERVSARPGALDEPRTTTAPLSPAAESAQTLKQVSILLLNVLGLAALNQRLDLDAVSAFMDDALSRGTAIVGRSL